MVHWKARGLFGAHEVLLGPFKKKWYKVFAYKASHQKWYTRQKDFSVFLESTENFCVFRGLLKRPTLQSLQIKLNTKNYTLEGNRPFRSLLEVHWVYLRSFEKTYLEVFADKAPHQEWYTGRQEAFSESTEVSWGLPLHRGWEKKIRCSPSSGRASDTDGLRGRQSLHTTVGAI